MVELLHGLDGAGEVAIEADHVAVMGFHPDASEEAPILALAADGRDIEYRGGDVPEKVVADEGEGVVLPIEAVRVHQDHLDEAGLMEGETEARGDAAEGREGVLEEGQFALLRLEVALVILVGVIVDDLAEVDAGQVVLVRLRHLQQQRIGLHVLDVGLDQGSAFLDNLDHFLLAGDCLVNQRILSRGQLAARHGVLFDLLLAEDRRSRQRGRGCREEKCQ